MTPKIKPTVNGNVHAVIPEEVYDAEVAADLGLELIEAAYVSRAIKGVDEVMDRHRRKYVEDVHPQWELLNQVWRDLRLEFGYDDDPRTGGWKAREDG